MKKKSSGEGVNEFGRDNMTAIVEDVSIRFCRACGDKLNGVEIQTDGTRAASSVR